MPAQPPNPQLAASHSVGRNITVCSSVFICTRLARSNAGWPLVAGALIPYLPRAWPTTHMVPNSKSTVSSVTRAGNWVMGGPRWGLPTVAGRQAWRDGDQAAIVTPWHRGRMHLTGGESYGLAERRQQRQRRGRQRRGRWPRIRRRWRPDGAGRPDRAGHPGLDLLQESAGLAGSGR